MYYARGILRIPRSRFHGRPRVQGSTGPSHYCRMLDKNCIVRLPSLMFVIIVGQGTGIQTRFAMEMVLQDAVAMAFGYWSWCLNNKTECLSALGIVPITLSAPASKFSDYDNMLVRSPSLALCLMAVLSLFPIRSFSNPLPILPRSQVCSNSPKTIAGT